MMTTQQATLIDDLLPCYDFRERHSIAIRAPANLILDCVLRQRVLHDPIVRLAVNLRELPSRLMGQGRKTALDFDDFTFLGRDRNSSLALGLIGAFWRADYGLLNIDSVTEFKVSDRIDVCRLVMGFAVEHRPDGETRLITETRVFCPSAEVRRKFTPYWYVIRPVSGLIRRRLLARVRRQAEGLAGTGDTAGLP